jgi:hypothetical protein
MSAMISSARSSRAKCPESIRCSSASGCRPDRRVRHRPETSCRSRPTRSASAACGSGRSLELRIKIDIRSIIIKQIELGICRCLGGRAASCGGPIVWIDASRVLDPVHILGNRRCRRLPLDYCVAPGGHVLGRERLRRGPRLREAVLVGVAILHNQPSHPGWRMARRRPIGAP